MVHARNDCSNPPPPRSAEQQARGHPFAWRQKRRVSFFAKTPETLEFCGVPTQKRKARFGWRTLQDKFLHLQGSGLGFRSCLRLLLLLLLLLLHRGIHGLLEFCYGRNIRRVQRIFRDVAPNGSLLKRRSARTTQVNEKRIFGWPYFTT